VFQHVDLNAGDWGPPVAPIGPHPNAPPFWASAPAVTLRGPSFWGAVIGTRLFTHVGFWRLRACRRILLLRSLRSASAALFLKQLGRRDSSGSSSSSSFRWLARTGGGRLVQQTWPPAFRAKPGKIARAFPARNGSRKTQAWPQNVKRARAGRNSGGVQADPSRSSIN